MCLVFETGKGAIEALHYCKIYWHVLLFLDCSVTRNNFCVPCSISPLASTRTFNNTVEGTLRPITRLQNGRIFCERERRIIFERKAGASEKTARENGERRGRVRLARFTLEDHAYGASRLPKTTVLQSTCLIDKKQWILKHTFFSSAILP